MHSHSPHAYALVTIAQGWQNVLCLLEFHDKVVSTASGRTRVLHFYHFQAHGILNTCSCTLVIAQVWQNVLCLLEFHDKVVSTASGRTRVVLEPGKRILIDLSMCAAIFTQYGFDKDGLMPYVVFINVSVLVCLKVLLLSLCACAAWLCAARPRGQQITH